MNDGIVTTQATSKRWKALMLVGGILAIMGALTWYCAREYLHFHIINVIPMEYDLNMMVDTKIGGTLMVIVGSAAWLCGWIGAWWNHG